MRFISLVTLLALSTFSGCDSGSPTPVASPITVERKNEPNSSPKPKAALPGASSANTAQPQFVDVATTAGLSAKIFCGGPNKEHILESVGSGCAWIDYDADGLLDVFLVNAWALDDSPRQVREKGHCVLYRNLGQGRFEDVTAKARVGGDDWGCGVCAADFDNDGHVDLYVTNFGPNRLYRNRGDGTFDEMAERAGVSTPGWSEGAAFFDADGDGWLDLYVAKYIECTFDEVLKGERTNVWRDTAKVMVGPFGLRGGKDKFFHNNHDGTFTDATEKAGMEDTAESYGMGVIASDLDGDGDVDVYVANDSNPNFLYRNDGNGTFTEIGRWSGAGVSGEGRAQGSMGVDAGDIDGDGLEEIVTTNFAQDVSTIYKNEGDLLFRDLSAELQMKDFNYREVKWGCVFFDYDLDGRVDLLQLNGHIYPQVNEYPALRETYKQLPTLLHNVDGKFEDVSRQAGTGMQLAESMRGLAAGDYDNDGRPDLLITAIDSPPLLLHNETKTDRHWATVRLINKYGSPAINAVVRLTAGGATQIREVRSGSTYCSQSSFDANFGLGEAKEIQTLEIRWPGGNKSTEHNLLVDKLHTFREPPGQP